MASRVPISEAAEIGCERWAFLSVGLAHVNTLVADSGAGGVFRVALPAAASRQSTRQTMSMLARDNRSPSQRISGRKEEAKQEAGLSFKVMGFPAQSAKTQGSCAGP